MDGLINVEKVLRLRKGESVANGFPVEAAYQMSDLFKKNTLLTDTIHNAEEFPLCSEKLKNYIQNKKPDHVEYLPVKIQDHKKKPLPDKYFIVLPLDPVDCIDFEKSDVRLLPGGGEPNVLGVKKLVIAEDKAPSDRLLWRPKGFNRATFIQRDFAEELVKKGFSGFGFKELEHYKT